MKAIVFTDGSSRGNPGPGGYGAIVIVGNEGNEKVYEVGGSEKMTTNNRMEMKAAIEGARKAREYGAEVVTIYTDSSYLLNGATKWAYGWQNNDWKTKTKGEVLNRDLWEMIINLSELVKIEWKLLPGHSGIPANERCDVIATSFADGTPVKLFKGNLSIYPINIKTVEATAENILRKKSSKGGKAYSYVSLVDGVIKTHKTWAECEKRVKGMTKTRFRKALSPEDESEIIKDFS